MSTAAPTPAHKPGTYEVARPGGKCIACSNPIEPDQKFMAVLRETPGGFERLDVCNASAVDALFAEAERFGLRTWLKLRGLSLD